MKIQQQLMILVLITLQFTTILTVDGSQTLPLTKNYSLPGQSWFFINEGNFNNNSLIQFNWTCNISVQGREVSQEDYQKLFDYDLIARSAYFESLTYNEGIFDSGKITTSSEGDVFFVFFNPNSNAANLVMIFDNTTTALQPWIIGLFSTIGIIIILSIGIYVVIKIRRKMLKEAEEEQQLSPEQLYLGKK
ncbi:MAG: hypothetical protein ACFFDW_10735 [Candidatus Thorarchaeota archaeon]